ncbi:transposase [Chitinophagaceae bacterium LWZ2-11]
MPVPEKFLARFEEGCYYHLICKSGSSDLLFRCDENREFFLQQVRSYFTPFFKMVAYCLLDNHVHFLVEVRSVFEISSIIKTYPKEKLKLTYQRFLVDANKHLNELLIKQLNSFFISYTRSFNKKYERAGHLFLSPFKRILIETDEHLTQTIIYIHANPFKHRLVNDFSQYRWSSYQSVILPGNTNIERDFVLSWFGGRDKYIITHIDQAEYYYSDIE